MNVTLVVHTHPVPIPGQVLGLVLVGHLQGMVSVFCLCHTHHVLPPGFVLGLVLVGQL